MGSYEALFGPEDNMIRRQFQHKAHQKVLTCQKRIKMRHSATDRPTNRKTKENTMNETRSKKSFLQNSEMENCRVHLKTWGGEGLNREKAFCTWDPSRLKVCAFWQRSITSFSRSPKLLYLWFLTRSCYRQGKVLCFFRLWVIYNHTEGLNFLILMNLKPTNNYDQSCYKTS